MEGEGGGRKAQALGNLACGKARGTLPNEGAKDLQTVLLGQGGERGNGGPVIHISII